MFNLNTRVVVTNSQRTGRVAGHAAVTRQGNTDAMYLVDLDAGFYSEDHKDFVSLLTVHPDNLTEVRDAEL